MCTALLAKRSLDSFAGVHTSEYEFLRIGPLSVPFLYCVTPLGCDTPLPYYPLEIAPLRIAALVMLNRRLPYSICTDIPYIHVFPSFEVTPSSVIAKPANIVVLPRFPYTILVGRAEDTYIYIYI